MRGLSLVVASGGHSSSWCAGLSLSQPLLLWSTASRRAGSVIVAHGPSCSTACGIFPDQGSNPCPLHWQADSQPPRHQGSPALGLICGMWDLRCGVWDLLSCGMRGSLVAAFGIFSYGMRDLVPWPGIKPRLPALGAWSLNCWTTREVPGLFK